MSNEEAKISKNLVHAGSPRHQDMKRKIQSKLEALAHPEIRCNEDWLELRLSWRRRHVCCTPQFNKRNIQVGVSTKHGYWVDIIGQLKIENSIYQIISQNQLQYSTCGIYNYHNPWLQHQAHQWGLTPPHHTHLRN